MPEIHPNSDLLNSSQGESMRPGRWALSEDGSLQWCSLAGKRPRPGPCNHIAHAFPGESLESFQVRCQWIQDVGTDVPALPDVDLLAVGGSSTSGQQQKWFDHEHALWFKEDHTDRNEGLAEVLSSLLLNHSSAEHICYNMKTYRDGYHLSIGCQSSNFREPNEFELSIRALLPPHCLVSLAYDSLPLQQQFRLLWKESVQALQHLGLHIESDRVKQYLLHAFSVDCLILNSDRHLGNLVFLINPKTATARPAPLFDHGGALCVDTSPEMFPLSLSAEQAERMAFLGTFQDSDPEHTARMIQELLEEDPRSEFRLVFHDIPDLKKQLKSLDLRCYGTDLPERTIALLLRRLEKLEGKLWWSSSAL